MGADARELLSRIEALRSRTTDRGCTEAEAMAAAAKVAVLLDRHGLSMSDLELQAQPCGRLALPTGRSRIGPLDDCAPAVAAFFDCRFWFETDAEGRLNQVFFGLPADLAAAAALMPLIAQAFETEANRFRAGRRRALHTSFVLGLSHGIQAKLAAMRTEREAALRPPFGRNLVLAKDSVVDAEMARLGLRFRFRNPAVRPVNADAFDAGHEAGQRIDMAGQR